MAVGILLLFGAAVLSVAVVVGGAQTTEIHIDRLALEGTTTAFFFLGAGAALATGVGVGCLVVGIARRRSSRSGPDPYPDDRGNIPDDRGTYPDDGGNFPDDRDPHPDDAQVRRAGDRPARPLREWTEYGSAPSGRRPRRTVPRDD